MRIKTVLLTFPPRYIDNWHRFLLKEVNEGRLKSGVMRPIQHYLRHMVFITEQQGVLKSYSARSMERTIGRYKSLINSVSMVGENAGNVLERIAVQNYLRSLPWDIAEIVDLMTPRPYRTDSFKEDPSGNPNLPQLWEPFFDCDPSTLPLEVSSTGFMNALAKFYQRISPSSSVSPLNTGESLCLSSRAWAYNEVYHSELQKKQLDEYTRENTYIMFSATHVE